MTVTFLGTGTSQGIPVIGCGCSVCQSHDAKDKRLRTSCFVQHKNTGLVVDCGPDFRQQMLVNGLENLDAVLFTHEHQDHVAGIDDLRAINFQKNKPVDLYCTERVEKRIRTAFSYAFADKKYPGAPVLDFKPLIPFQKLQLGGIEVLPIPAMHGHWPVVGFLFNKTFCYLTDVKSLPNETLKAVEGVEVLVLNALRIEPHHSHLSLHEAVELSQRIGAKQTYLTHISHTMGLHSEISKSLPNPVSLAWDGLNINLEQNRLC